MALAGGKGERSNKIWRVSTETLKRREKAGLLLCLKTGRGVRYRLSDILAFESAAEVGGHKIVNAALTRHGPMTAAGDSPCRTRRTGFLLSRRALAQRWGCCNETLKRRERAGARRAGAAGSATADSAGWQKYVQEMHSNPEVA